MGLSADALSVLGIACLMGGALYAVYQLTLKPPRGPEGPEGPPEARVPFFPEPEPAPKPEGPPESPQDWGRLASRHVRHDAEHAARVRGLALALAAALGLDAEAKTAVGLLATLHDLGALDVPEALYAKAGPLSPPERLALEGQAAKGAQRVLALTEDPALAQWARWLHERYDGLGYPDGLAGAAIPLPSRIVAIAEAAEALSQPRPFRPKPLAPPEVGEALAAEAGAAFDPRLLRLFLERVWPYQKTYRRRDRAGEGAM